MFLPYQEIFIWGLVISFIITVIYRVFTKPEEIRKIKEEMKFYKDKSKEAQKNKDTKKVSEYSSEMLKLSQKQMKHNMKPMFITMGIIILILGYVNNTYSGVAVETMQIDDTVSMGYFSYAGFNYSLRSEQVNEDEISVLIDTNDNGDFSDETAYSNGEIAYIDGIQWSVQPTDMENTRMDIIILLPFTIPIVGWTNLNWLWWYILVTLPTTWLMRKFMGVE